MNILYSIDEMSKDYARYLGVSILSLLEHNRDEDIKIYILSEYIELSNKKEIIKIVEDAGKKIYFSEGKIIPEKFRSELGLNNTQPMATYYRFFFGDKFDIKERVLYLDCDTIVNKNISKFYNCDFDGNFFIGNIDLPITSFARKVEHGLSHYINAGVVLININLFNIDELYYGIVDFNKRYGKPELNDQDYLNFIYNGKIKLYHNLQHFIYNPRGNKKYKKCLIIHCMKDPNKGPWTFCPVYIRSIFDSYLKKTKWCSYAGYSKKMNLKDYIKYIKEFITLFFMGVSTGIFGYKNVYTFIKFVKNCFNY